MRNYPYEHAPRLPEAESIDPRSLFINEPAGGDSSAQQSVDSEGRLELEVGPGRGWFIFERLDIDPTTRVLGLEIRRKWATIVDDRLKSRGLASRGRVFAEDAKPALKKFQPDSIDIAYVHFPDPWWKKRHAKRLVVCDALLNELGRVVKSGGELLIQTDVEERAEQYEAIVREHGAFVPWEAEARVVDHPHGARSPRERKAIEDGLPVYRLRYRRLEVVPPPKEIPVDDDDSTDEDLDDEE
jgi:tRNA (guanine-N7-)-methyltransferase